MQLSGTFLALLFVCLTVRPLTGSIAIFDELASRARLEATPALATSGTLVRRTHGILSNIFSDDDEVCLAVGR